MFSAFMLLMENCVKYGLAENIWNHLMDGLESKKSLKEIKLVRNVIKNKVNQFNKDIIIIVINKLNQRI